MAQFYGGPGADLFEGTEEDDFARGFWAMIPFTAFWARTCSGAIRAGICSTAGPETMS